MANDIKLAIADFQAAQTDLKNGDLGAYQTEENLAYSEMQVAQAALAKK